MLGRPLEPKLTSFVFLSLLKERKEGQVKTVCFMVKSFLEGIRLRLGTFGKDGRAFPGVIMDDGRVADLSGCGYDSLLSILNDTEAFGVVQGMLAERKNGLAVYSLDEVKTMAPLAKPGKIICIGKNYMEHAREMSSEAPTEPVFFAKFANSIIGPGDSIVMPRTSDQVDYEAELAVVIGRKGRFIPVEEAMDYVAGYTIFNDVSARDLQMRGGQWMKGKALETFAPTGPYLVTVDEVPNPHKLDIKLWLNDSVMQDSNTSNFIFDIPFLISFLSELFTLEPGDIIATGTPPGVGFARKPPVFMKPGDQVRIQIEGIGELENSVIGPEKC